jgi:hypothetical protein
MMERFAAMYRAKHFDADLFDLDGGFLQTTLSDDAQMPLRFFVEYNNVWWFEVISTVEVPTAAYDPVSEYGFIVLDISYGRDLLRAAPHVRFAGDRVQRIRTYASSAFFSMSGPLVELDRHGNAVWLETGYDLPTSTEAAEVFLRTPRGRGFAATEPTAEPAARILRNLADLRQRCDQPEGRGDQAQTERELVPGGGLTLARQTVAKSTSRSSGASGMRPRVPCR